MRRERFVYDTEPACRTVVMAREHWGEDDERVLTVFHAIQRAFYAEGRDTTHTDVLRQVVLAHDIDAVTSPWSAEIEAKLDAVHQLVGNPCP